MYDPRLAGPPDPRIGYLAEGQQGPPMYPPALAPNPAPPVLDTRAMQRPTQAFNQYAQRMRQMAPDPNKQRLAYQIGSVLGPALFGKVAGGSGKQAALYGVGSAAFNYQDQLDRFRKTEADIAAAELQMPGAEQQYTINQAKVAEAEYMMQHPELQSELLKAQAYGQSPSAVREYQYFMNLSPEQKAEWLRNKRAGTAWVDAQGDQRISWGANNQERLGQSNQAPGAVFNREYAGTAGQQAAETSPVAVAGQANRVATIEGAKAEAVDLAAGLNATQSVVSTAQQGLDSLYRARAAIEAGPDTNALSDWQAILDPELQALNAVFNDQTMASMVAAKASGATFGSLSEGEWKLLGKLGPQITNTKAGNLKLIKQKIAVLEETERRARESWKRLNEKGIRSLPPAKSRGRPGDAYLEEVKNGN